MRLAPLFIFAIALAALLAVAACREEPQAPAAAPLAAQINDLGDVFPEAKAAPATSVATPVAEVAPALVPAAWAERPACCWFPAPALSASAAVVLDEASGEVVFEQDAHRRLAPASLTKVATAMVVLESGIGLDTVVTTDVDSTLMYGSSVMGLEPGDQFTVRDLLYGLLLPSGNDAALALGRAVAGSDAAFVAMMNDLVERLGLTDTHFANAHGLGSRDHYSSAYDLALLSRYAMTDPTFAETVRTPSWVATGSRTIELPNVNPFLAYPGADGLKTGYTNRAGKTLIASATRDGHRLYAVLLNAPDRDGDAWKLMDWAFDNSTWK